MNWTPPITYDVLWDAIVVKDIIEHLSAVSKAVGMAGKGIRCRRQVSDEI